MERLRISNNKRYFIKDSGEPFIWIADTAWTLPQRMKWDDVEYYMKKRKSQGFTVLQIVALDPERDVEMRNPAGEKALIGGDLSRPNEMYFRYLDWIIDKAEEYGLYILLLPVWDGEPGYEAMPTCWPITDESSFHDASVVRKRAYWSLLAGAFGYTYGHCNVWCTISEKEKNIISKTDWFEAMSSTASGQIIYLHSAMEALELYRCSPCQEILLEQSEREEPIDEHIQAAVVCGGTALCIYFPSGGKETLDIQMFDGEKQEFYGWWYNTRDGKFYTPEFVICEEPVIYWTQDHKLKVTAPEKELNHDWLFILQKEPGEKPIIQKKATLENKVEDLKKVFEW